MNSYKKSDYLYTALFCEENIWHLAQSLFAAGIKSEDIQIVFITNKNKQIAIFNQIAVAQNQAVIWDYHVILLLKTEQSHSIFDFDSRLGFTSDYQNYLKNSLPDNIITEYSSVFRIIPAQVYLNYFDSDRSHMQGVIDKQDFPQYPAIISNSEFKLNLRDLFDSQKELKQTSIVQNTQQLKAWIKNIT
ncbi:MAG: hypothetical protein QM479_12240 [Pseudomonadota bacterium]